MSQLMKGESLHINRQQRCIINDVSIAVESGQVLALLGANGAGKSTLLSVLSGEIKQGLSSHDKIRVSINGRDLASLSELECAQIRGVLPQNASLTFDMKVLEIIEMGMYPFPDLSMAEVGALLEKAMQWADVVKLRDRNYRMLSGGEQQRVQFARVLVQLLAQREQNPAARYMLLDEPTSSLDPKYQQHLLSTLGKLARQENIGILIILHDLNLAARYCDRIALLANGKLIACDVPEAVLTRDNLYAVYGIYGQAMAHPFEPGKQLVIWE
ncbi:MAG: heme ABC transporter ATP-binding protein [Alcaligenaceae bacterium]|nr:heme ABC transporter ATP-binding protein [Alcaligenaceae bacterium]